MKFDTQPYRVQPGAHVSLHNLDPEDTGTFEGGKREGEDALKELNKTLEVLQEKLYAEHKHAVLIILQGIDTSGKDGAIEHVFDGVNPQGVRVASFKAPTPLELEHDFLWRIHQKTPGKGEIVIFNRSQYEDVFIVRVHELVPEKVWSRRYSHINNFEKLLVDEGTTILKFFLHIDKQEQSKRFLDRLTEEDKHWKFNPGDLKERKKWDAYQHAYEDALSMTSTEWAPWYIVPSNRKWFRNLLIASVLVETIQALNPQPENPFTEAELESFREQLKDG